MTGSEVFLYGLIILVVLLYARRFLLVRSIQHYTAAELAERLAGERNLVLLDVRSRGEREHSHIKGSLHIPLSQLSQRVEELNAHRGKEIICYCQTGNRSLTAASRLKKQGFQVANLKGGITEWNFHHR